MYCDLGIQFIFHFSQCSFCHLAWKSQYQNIIYIKRRKKSFFLSSKTKLLLLLQLEMISIKMCQVLWEQFCCSYIYTKAARKRSQLSKETTWVVKLLRYSADLPVSAVICRLDFSCFVGIHIHAFSTLSG